MTTNNIRETVAKNLVFLRKERKLTQQELAQELGYSDKAISRWERGEALPDLETLCRICEIYDIRLEDILNETLTETPQKTSERRPYYGNKLAITLIAVFSVWLLATMAFVYNYLQDVNTWIVFIWALPVTALVILICNRLWGTRVIKYIALSAFVWTFILSVCMQMYLAGKIAWLFFVVGAPIQAIIILSFTLKHNR